MRTHKYYDLLLAAFVCCLLCVNLIGAGKVASIQLPVVGYVEFGAGVLFFPIAYLFSDLFTEVYGYKYDRRAVWCGFFALSFAALMTKVVILLNPAQGEYMNQYQMALDTVFGNTWRIVLASLLAYACGSFVNAYVLAKMKILTKGKHLWTRTIGSTLAGELIDSSLFYILAFYGVWEINQLWKVALIQYILKSSWEIVMTPVTYRIVAWLKRVEQEDYYDKHTVFNPFSIKI